MTNSEAPSQSPARRANRVAVVTGASAGVGRATALALARRGYDIVLLARGEAGLAGARREIEQAGRQALAIPTDVADCEAVFRAADAAAARFGHIDLWINNAMATVFGPVDSIPAAEFRRVTEVTYLGVVHGTLAALRHMRARNCGTIVQVGSALAYRAIPLQAPYCAAKFAVRGFTDSLRCELIRERSAVRLTMVQLPGVNTPQFDWSRTHMAHRHQPVGAVYQPEAVARAIVDAAERAPRELWVGLSAMTAIASAMIAPGYGDRHLAATAYDQQVDEAVPADGDILDAPASRDHGTRGRFGAQANTSIVAADAWVLRMAAGCAAAAAFAIALVLSGRLTGPRRSA